MKNIGKHLIQFGKDLQEMEKEGISIEMNYEMINTGIVEKHIFNQSMWREYEDLGGRDIKIHIIIPNKVQ